MNDVHLRGRPGHRQSWRLIGLHLLTALLDEGRDEFLGVCLEDVVDLVKQVVDGSVARLGVAARAGARGRVLGILRLAYRLGNVLLDQPWLPPLSSGAASRMLLAPWPDPSLRVRRKVP